MRKRSTYHLGLFALALAVAATAVTSAYGWHNSSPGQTAFYGYTWLSPGQGAGSRYDSETICTTAVGSSADWSYPGEITVAIINANGNWVKAASSTAQEVAVFLDNIDPNYAATFNKKAHCVNSGNNSVWVACRRSYWVDTSHCA